MARKRNAPVDGVAPQVQNKHEADLESALDIANSTIEALEYSLGNINKDYQKVIREMEVYLGAIALMNEKATVTVPKCFITTMMTSQNFKTYCRISDTQDLIINVIEEKVPTILQSSEAC